MLCPTCGWQTATQEQMLSHLREMHGCNVCMAGVACDICHKEHLNALKQHCQSHEDERIQMLKKLMEQRKAKVPPNQQS